MSDEVQPCAIIVPYYNNPEMLKHQVSVWERYSGALTENMQFVLVDDCSKYPAEPIFKQLKHNKMLFRVRERLPWNQHQCRNIGAFNAMPRKHIDNPWLLLTDIDIVFTAETMLTLLTKKLDTSHHYTVERTFAPEFTERKVHPNTFVCTKNAFKTINGYDLDLTGGYGGGYGGDGEFARQLSGVCPGKHLKDVLSIGYGRRKRDGQPTVFSDADTQEREYDREMWSQKYREAFNRKRAKGDMRSLRPIRVDYERII
jgi:hypothetical protein